jgi:hypothetical protein
MVAPQPHLTREEARIAERVGLFLLPIVRDAIQQRLGKPSDAAEFAREFRELRRVRDAIPSSAGGMARVEIELQMLELAERFAESHAKG